MDFLHHVQGIVVLNELGGRVFAKYYINAEMQTAGVLNTMDKQRALELGIHAAARDPKRGCSNSMDGDVMIHGGHTVLLHVFEDITFIVIGDGSENELVLHSVLRGLVDAMRQELKVSDLNLRILLGKYDAVLLTVDELVDEGIILETNPNSICQDVAPFVSESGGEAARKALDKVNKYLKDTL
ncbi:coatomer zeta subunit [Trypanosoma cruzi]|uniref:Coatomer subunit zeta n=2 Tax=Trypanosoma cruzi TaxID=5693 RepID=V5BSX4_TRYCR|nr:coatomer zeta subunit [Trypanosoma cruzi Dm28c]KAF8280004.1 putative coatomer subunit zeta [Trypanosoma cruzi]PBJ69502.1 coatomer zeta subunit [Trypanosoma cruzi cruzi]PWU89978.1 putative coatomer subunit zeta [Trypanosoma cruzi]RNF13001.1 coatomer zeta subunit [Trypanosoma cruzi]